MDQLVGVQVQVKVAKKCKKTPTCDVTPSKRLEFFWLFKKIKIYVNL